MSTCRQRFSPPELQIAVIVPSFQPGAYLGETLASIERQTHPPEEVVVVDDGSEPPVELPSSPMPIRVLRIPHGGIAAARNAGVLATTAPLVHICDHDDILEPLFYERQIAAFTDAIPPDIAYSVCGFIDKDGAVLPGRLPWNEPPDGNRKGPLRALLHGNEIASVAAVFRRTTFDDLRGFRSLDYVQDWDFWLRAATHGSRFKAISDILAWHRVHPAQQSSEARRVLALEESLMMLSSAGLPARLWLTARRARSELHLQLSRLLRARGEPGVVRHALQGFAGKPLQTSRAVLGASR